MKKFKRILSLALAATMLLSLIACGKSEEELSAVTRTAAEDDGTVWFDEDAVALASSVVSANAQADQTRATELQTMAQDILTLVNAQRAASGLGALTWSTGLESCALVRSQEIVSKFSHTRPNGTSWYTVDSNLMWGENLAKGYASAQEVVDAWMASPSHAANILASDFTTCSIAIFESNGKLYMAQEFGY